MRLHAYAWGDPEAPPVVCLHGVIGHGLRFRRLAEERLASRFRVVALDLRGHGHSEWDPPWDIATHVEDVVETTAALGIEAASWIGHSFGGRLVMELASRDPTRVERAVLLDPAIWVPPPIALERAEAERVERAFRSRDEASEQRIVSGGLRHTPPEILDEELDAHLVAHEDGLLRYRYSQASVVTAFAELAKPPPPFEALRLPTLLVRSVEAEIVPDVLLEVYAAGVGEQLRMVDVPGGHHVLWDAYEQTADAVDEFLA